MKNIQTLSLLAALGAATFAQAAPKAAPSKPIQRVTISLPMDYKSGAAKVKAGQPVALTFYLKSDAGCGNSVSVPAAKWSKTLKVGQKATLVYTPKKSGSLAFQCSMNHMKGSLIVR